MYYALYHNIRIEFVIEKERDRYVTHDPVNRKKIVELQETEDCNNIVTYSCINCIHGIQDNNQLSKSVICKRNGWEDRLWVSCNDPEYTSVFDPENKLARGVNCIHFIPTQTEE